MFNSKNFKIFFYITLSANFSFHLFNILFIEVFLFQINQNCMNRNAKWKTAADVEFVQLMFTEHLMQIIW